MPLQVGNGLLLLVQRFVLFSELDLEILQDFLRRLSALAVLLRLRNRNKSLVLLRVVSYLFVRRFIYRTICTVQYGFGVLLVYLRLWHCLLLLVFA